MRYTLFIAIMGAALVLTGCGIKAPKEDLEKAKSSISRLEAVEASQFAEKDYQEAQMLYTAGETNMVTNKKSKQNKVAKEFFIKANTQASNTYDKAAPKYADHYIGELDTSVQKAKEIKADVAVKEDYAKAEALLKESQDLKSKKKYAEAGKKAKESKTVADEAYTKAAAKKEESEKAIKEAQDKIDSLK